MNVCLVVQVYTVEDRTEIEEHVPSAREICRLYNSTWLTFMDLKAKMEALWSKVVDLHHTDWNFFHVLAHKFY